MERIAEPEELEGLDPALRRFIDAAWTPPSTESSAAGVRRLNLVFSDQREIMTAAAAVMKDAFQQRGQNEEVAYNPNPAVNAFEQWTWYEDTRERVCRLLVTAWNERRDLGTCQNCGSLLLPGKGRVAKYCNDVCRMRMNRSVDVQVDGKILIEAKLCKPGLNDTYKPKPLELPPDVFPMSGGVGNSTPRRR